MILMVDSRRWRSEVMSTIIFIYWLGLIYIYFLMLLAKANVKCAWFPWWYIIKNHHNGGTSILIYKVSFYSIQLSEFYDPKYSFFISLHPIVWRTFLNLFSIFLKINRCLHVSGPKNHLRLENIFMETLFVFRFGLNERHQSPKRRCLCARTHRAPSSLRVIAGRHKANTPRFQSQ